MMLLDRLREAQARVIQSGRVLNEGEKSLCYRLNGASAYELTNVLPLISDFERYADRDIPKRAPQEKTWCEWACPKGEVGQRYGVSMHEFVVGEKGYSGPYLKNAQPGDVIFTTLAFGWGKLGTSEWHLYYCSPTEVHCFSPSGRAIGANSIDFSRGRTLKEAWEKTQIFNLPLAVESDPEDGDEEKYIWWQPIMAFMLMQCKNVAVDRHEPDEKTQRRVRRSGNPPRSSWHTLSLRIPATHTAKSPSSSERDGEGVRFHLCSGHFKNLQHERFKEKGLHWWPAHWRGDPELGTVITDRILKPND